MIVSSGRIVFKGLGACFQVILFLKMVEVRKHGEMVALSRWIPNGAGYLCEALGRKG